MTILEVYDRPLCCSTGICGPSVDPALVHFAADLDWLKGLGVEVHRYNLAFEPAAFTKHPDVKTALQVGQIGCLPLVRIDGNIVCQGCYPNREQLAGWCGVQTEQASAPKQASCCCGPSCCT